MSDSDIQKGDLSGTYDLDDLPYDEEDDGDSNGDGEGGGKSPRRYRVIVEPFLDFADDPSLSPEENAERKLRLLAISPMSILVPGASSFASENDLSRKIFMVDVGRANGEASASDMADPAFVDKRDALQYHRRTFFGLPHPSLILSSGMALASAVIGAFASFAAAVSGQVNPDKFAKQEEKKNDKLRDFGLDKESAFSVSQERYKGEDSVPHTVGPDFGGLLDHVTIETITEMVEVTRTALDFDSLSSFFNFLSEVAQGPVARVTLKGGGKSGSQQVDGPSVPWQDFSPVK